MTRSFTQNLIAWSAVVALALLACSKSAPTSSTKPDDDQAAHQDEPTGPGAASDPATPHDPGEDGKSEKMRLVEPDPAPDRMSTTSAINVEAGEEEEDADEDEDEDEAKKGVGKAIMMDE